MKTLESINIQGFKSIRDQTLELDRLNIFIGANGSGKSNLIGVFKFLREVARQNLSTYSRKNGGADYIFYFGRKETDKLQINLRFRENAFVYSYDIIVDSNRSGDLLLLESASVKEGENDKESVETPFLSGESILRDWPHPAAEKITQSLDEFRIYHFHDTSHNARMKSTCDVNDNRVLREQGENLSAFLYYLQQRQPTHFRLIEDTVKQVAPFFDRFILEPDNLNDKMIRLEWKEKGHDTYFDAQSLSDGTLRFICLATLLLQPSLPEVLLLDEPEIGLHPAAIRLLTDLLESASLRSQLIVATQSVTLINQLTPNQVWTVDREDQQSKFSKLSTKDYEYWLDDYSLGEIWEKNLIHARP